MGIDAERAAVSWPHVSPHCSEIHTYSHTQKFSKINCVNSHAPLAARAIAGGGRTLTPGNPTPLCEILVQRSKRFLAPVLSAIS
jgi:hypothetical protein